MTASASDGDGGARIAFFGTPEIAAIHLRALLGAGYRPAVVYSQPDRPKGRGKKMVAPPVKIVAEEAGIPVRQPERIRKRAVIDEFVADQFDLAIVVAYGQVLAERMITAPAKGAWNMHASLLPRWRGAAPIEWAILAGDAETGACVQRVVRGLDEGPVIAAATLPIRPGEDRTALHDRLAALGADLVVQALPDLLAGRQIETPQATDGVTYAPIPTKADARLDLSEPAEVLARRIRALHHDPGTWLIAELADGRTKRVKILDATPIADADYDPADTPHVRVPCAPGTALLVRRLQPESKKPMDADAFLAGHALMRFTTPE